MCGIVIQASFGENAVNKNLIHKMAKDIVHRGPDDEGYYFNSWVGIGFKRLAIIDLSDSAHQPMFDESKSYLIAFNGEIYNYKNIRYKLKALGYNFFSNSDTEVALKAFIEWGTSAFNMFEGMFAIVIYNNIKDELIVARDHLGIKPLYYYMDQKNILFSSEIKTFRHYTEFAVNKENIYEQLVYNYVSGKETIYNNIFRLLPGNYMVIKPKQNIKTFEYYNVLDNLINSTKRKIDYDIIESMLDKSIKMHTQSDVGYNVQLSGGLDSSYITAVLNKKHNQKISTFSVELPGYDKNEKRYQKLVVDKYNTSHFGHAFSDIDYAENLPKATWHMDMPIIHGAGVFLMLLCAQSFKNSKVILTGEGADELFGGYSRYKIGQKNKFINWLQNYSFKPNHLLKIKRIRKLLEIPIGLNEQIYHSNDRLLTLINPMSSILDYRKNNIVPFRDAIRKIIASDQTSYLQSLLERQDKLSMAMSVESRVPYTTAKLFDYVNNLDYNAKIKPVPKQILKKIAENYYDKEFIYRGKIGFPLPYAEWLREKKSLGRYMELLIDSTFKSRGIYRSRLVSQMVDEHYYKKRDHSKYLLKLIYFEIWQRIFIDKTMYV